MLSVIVPRVVRLDGSAGGAGETVALDDASADRTRKWYVVLAKRPVRSTECEVTIPALVAVEVSEPGAVPKSTTLVDGSSVVQVTLADDVVTELATAEIVGAVVSEE